MIVNVLMPDGNSTQTQIPDAPDTCPMCHHAVHMAENGTAIMRFEGSRNPRIQVCYRCPKKDCGTLFVYEYGNQLRAGGKSETYVAAIYPSRPRETIFPEIIKIISPNFIQIHRQAKHAAMLGLAELHGMGLRKALEFLIKDYCVLITPDAPTKETIKAQLLGSVIENHVSDSRIKACAKRAVWLGNDEAHYVKKWDANITDLDRLIHLTVNWIDSEHATNEYLEKMPDPKAQEKLNETKP